MKRSNRLVLLIGVFLAVLAFAGVLLLSGSGGTGTGPQASQVPTKQPTVFAATDIALGTVITKDMIRQQDFEIVQRDPSAFVSTTLVIGKVARRDIVAGAQLTALDFATGGAIQGGISVPAGLRAIAVSVDQVSGVGTIILTGDYVDIVAGVSTGAQQFPVVLPAPTPGLGIAPLPPDFYDHTSVKVLLQGLQVVGILLPPPPAEASPAPGTTASTGGTGTSLNGQQEIVILAVTAQEAEVIKFAQLDGSISLLLRSPKDFVDASGNPVLPTDEVTSGLTLKTLIDNWGVLPPTYLYTIVHAPTP